MARSVRREVRRGRRSVVVLSAVVAIATALVGATPAQADDAAAELSGRMVKADGSAWDSEPWRVSAVPVDGLGSEVTTELDPDGSYRLTGVPDGRYRVRAVPDEEHTGVPAMWLGGTLREADATVLDVTAGAPRDGLDILRFDGSNVPRRASATWTPYIKGTPRVGWTLTAEPQEWQVEDDWSGQAMPVTADLFTFQWLADGVPVPGATSKTFAPTARELGAGLSVRVGVDLPRTTTSNDTSRVTAPVVEGRNTPCSTLTLTGKAKVGRTLEARRSRCWTAPGTVVRHTWIVDGRTVATTTSPRVKLRRSYRGDTVVVQVSAAAPGYGEVTVRSNARKVR